MERTTPAALLTATDMPLRASRTFPSLEARHFLMNLPRISFLAEPRASYRVTRIENEQPRPTWTELSRRQNSSKDTSSARLAALLLVAEEEEADAAGCWAIGSWEMRACTCPQTSAMMELAHAHTGRRQLLVFVFLAVLLLLACRRLRC
jgi:hypothetical protein